MFGKMSISGTNLHSQEVNVLAILKRYGVLCDVDRGLSIVKNRADELLVEERFTITMFDIERETLRAVYIDLRVTVGIHCGWLEYDNHTGCTTEYFLELGLTCSEYAPDPDYTQYNVNFPLDN